MPSPVLWLVLWGARGSRSVRARDSSRTGSALPAERNRGGGNLVEGKSIVELAVERDAMLLKILVSNAKL